MIHWGNGDRSRRIAVLWRVALAALLLADCRDATGPVAPEIPQGSAVIEAIVLPAASGDTIRVTITNVGDIILGWGCPFYLDRFDGSKWSQVSDFSEDRGCDVSGHFLLPGLSYPLFRVAPPSLPAGVYRFRIDQMLDFADYLHGTAFPEELRVSNAFAMRGRTG